MKKVIFADDDATIQDVISLILGEEYEVTTFSKGDALMNHNFIVPDLFLLDKQLAGMDGLDICRFLKSQNSTKDIPVIIISAQPNIRDLARSAGADDVIGKPFPIQELRHMVAHYTGNPHRESSTHASGK